jgi:adenosylcobinamide-GDP ribazoletransferase
MKQVIQAAVLIPVGGRTTLVFMMFLLPYVRPEGGMGTLFYSQRNGWALAVSLVLFIGPFVGFLGSTGLAAIMVVLMTVFFFSRFCHWKIGGTTGDTMGAACEIVEAVIALCILFFYLYLP